MRKLIISSMLALLLGAAYVLWPVMSALNLRQAIKSGDVEMIDRKVDWVALRTSVRAALIEKVAQTETQSLWHRIKAVAAPTMIDRALNRSMTAQGLASMFTMREDYRHTVRPALGYGDAKRQLPLDGTWFEGGKIANLLDQMVRVEGFMFTSMTSVEIKIVDQYRSDTRYVAILALKDFDWKLVGLKLTS